jgi:hypothetical protein
VNVTREQVLAFRARRHGLGEQAPHRSWLELGVQDTPAGSAVQSLSVRGLSPARLVEAWSYRGGPHLHRASDLPWLAAALLPRSDGDANARGVPSVRAVVETARAVREVVTGRTSKGDASHDVTERIDPAWTWFCRGCGAVHVSDQLLRLAALPGGARIVKTTPLVLDAIKGWTVPEEVSGTERVLRAYLAVHGPATTADAAGYLGTTGTHVRDLWPDDLAEVKVDGRKVSLLRKDLGALRDAEPVEGVRLLPPSDPFLRARDRTLLVPDKAKAKTLWTVLASPGAVLLDSDVVGTWRAKVVGKRLAVSVASWRPVPKDALRAEAERVGQVRGYDDVSVT